MRQADSHLPLCSCRRISVAVKASAEPSTAPPAAPPAAVPRSASDFIAEEFSASKISFGAILTPIGVGLLTYGFGAFFQLLPGADLSSLMLIYGFPISVLGFALSYAQVGLMAASWQAAMLSRCLRKPWPAACPLHAAGWHRHGAWALHVHMYGGLASLMAFMARLTHGLPAALKATACVARCSVRPTSARAWCQRSGANGVFACLPAYVFAA